MAAKPIDRQTTTPFLLNLFYRSGPHHNPSDFLAQPLRLPYLQIYTWHSCTLRELSQLLATGLPHLLPAPARGTRLSYQMIYPDTKPGVAPRYLTKSLGSVVVAGADADGEGDDGDDYREEGGAPAGTRLPLDGDAQRTLQDSRFVVGDYVSVSILPPQANGEAAPPDAALPSSSRRGPSGQSFGGGYRGDPYMNRERAGMLAPPRENGYAGGGGYGGRPPRGGRYGFDFEGGGVPPGEWRRGDNPPPGGGGGGYGRPRGRGRDW